MKALGNRAMYRASSMVFLWYCSTLYCCCASNGVSLASFSFIFCVSFCHSTRRSAIEMVAVQSSGLLVVVVCWTKFLRTCRISVDVAFGTGMAIILS